MRAFTAEGRLSSAYSFDFLYAKRLSARRVKDAQLNWAGPFSEGWAAWAFSNHDAPRCISRWCPPGGDLVAYAKLTNALLLCLRGNPILYQGEELGLTQADIAFEDLQDPEAIANWPLTLGRDGARTPMPWLNDNSYAGFSEVKPWLPIGEGHALQAAAAQYGQPFSVLEFTRAMIALRNSMDVFRLGEVSFPDVPADMLAIERSFGEERVLCLFNLASESQEASAALAGEAKTLLSSDGSLNVPQRLAPFGVWIGKLAKKLK
ncbi:MAG: hypothetical protein B7X53_18710 [Hyphomonas sp. 34-62-18]|nr:MAG: hypothetical protein B7X53_18710 [Hyphomonas sp. 34-62-18]